MGQIIEEAPGVVFVVMRGAMGGVHTDPHASKILVQQMRRLSALRLEADVLVVHGR